MSNGNKNKRSTGRFIRDMVSCLLYKMPKKTTRSIWFKKQHGYKMNFTVPSTLDEKLNWLLTYVYDESYGQYVDKIEVREYVKQKGLEQLLPHVYGVWKSAYDISLDELPEKFILKCNHASGDNYYEIVYNKNMTEWKNVLERLEKMLHTNFARIRCQYQYDSIVPRVYAEELLDDGHGNRIRDYKVFCFHGKPHCIMVCVGRGTDLQRAFFDVNWNYLDYTENIVSKQEGMECPLGLEKMLEASKILSSDFPFARIDFYDVSGRVYFGEITFTPDNCNLKHLNGTAQKILGDMIVLK